MRWAMVNGRPPTLVSPRSFASSRRRRWARTVPTTRRRAPHGDTPTGVVACGPMLGHDELVEYAIEPSGRSGPARRLGLMTTSEGEFVCENCAQSFPINLATIVRTQAGSPDSPEASGGEVAFHDAECAEEHAARGGPRVADDA